MGGERATLPLVRDLEYLQPRWLGFGGGEISESQEMCRCHIITKWVMSGYCAAMTCSMGLFLSSRCFSCLLWFAIFEAMEVSERCRCAGGQKFTCGVWWENQ